MSYFVLFLTPPLHFIDMGTLTRYKSYPYLLDRELCRYLIFLICNRYFKVIDIVHFVIDHKLLCVFLSLHFLGLSFSKHRGRFAITSIFSISSKLIKSFVLKDKISSRYLSFEINLINWIFSCLFQLL
jgi:hypothetical protein